MRLSCFFLITGPLTLLSLPCAYADVLYLFNSDQITGMVTGVTETTILIHTEYAGDLEVQRDAVRALVTEGAFTVHREDGTTATGTLGLDGEVPGIQTEDGFVPAPVSALVPTVTPEGEPLPEEIPAKWTGFVESGLTIRSGNTDTTDFSLKSSATRKGEWTKLTLTLGADYGEADNIINTRRYKGEAKWEGYLTDRFYLFGLTSAEQDDGRKLDLRTTLGGGAGYVVIDNETRYLSLEGGVEHTWERWNPFTPQERDDTKNAIRAGAFDRLQLLADELAAGGQFRFSQLQELRDIFLDAQSPLRDFETRRNDFVSARFTGQFSQQLFKTSTLSDKLVVLPNLEDFGDYRLTNELAFSTPLTKALNLRISLESEYDSLADESNVDEWNHTLKTGLRYDF